MAVTTKKTFTAVGTSPQTSTTVFTPVGIELNNQDDLDVYVTKTTAGIAANNGKRILHFKQTGSSNVDANHVQVDDTTGLYFPAITHSGGTETLQNYTISSDNNTITFNSALPTGAIVSIERRTRDASSNYTNFVTGSTIRAGDLNSAFDESNYTAQEARNKTFDLEKIISYDTGWVTAEDIADNAITRDQIASGTITGTQLADNIISAAKLTSDSVTTAKIAADAVTNAKIAADAVGTDQIAVYSIVTNRIADDAVTNAKIADDAVSSAQIADDAVGTDQIAVNSIVTNRIADNAVTAPKIGAGAVTSAKIGAGEVNDTKLSSNSVTEIKIVDANVTAAKLASNAVTTAKIADDAVTSAKIADGTVGSINLEDGSVTTAKIDNGAVTETRIADNAVTLAKMAGLARGKIIVGDASGNPSALTVGSNNQVLKSDGTDISWGAAPSGDANQNAFSNIAVSGQTTVAADTTTDTLTIVGGTNVTVTTDASADSVTIAASGGEITVQDEGSSLSTAATTLNFVGAGVVASGTGASKTITISGSGGAAVTTDFQYLELKAHNNTSGAFSAGSADYELVTKGTSTAVDPEQAAALLISIAGVLQEPNTGTSIGSNDGFCIDGSSIHFGANLTAHPDYILWLKGAGSHTIADDSIVEAKLDIHADPAGTNKFLGYTSNGMEWAVPPDTNTTYSVQDGQLSQNNFTDADHTKLDALNSDKILEGNSSVEVVDAGTGYVVTTVDGTEMTRTTLNDTTYSKDAYVKMGTSTGENYGFGLWDTTNNVSTADFWYSPDADYVSLTSTKNFYIHSDSIRLRQDDPNPDTFIWCDGDSTSIYHNNSKRFETTADGVDISGTGSIKIPVGTTAQRPGSPATGDFRWNSTTSEAEIYNGSAFAAVGGGVGGATGVDFNDSVKARFGTGNDLEIYHDGTNSHIENSTGYLHLKSDSFSLGAKSVGENIIIAQANGNVELYYDGTKKFETTSGGVQATGQLNFAAAADPNISLRDSGKIAFGNGDDFKIYHDGSHSYIDDAGTGALKIRTNELQLLNAAGNEYHISAVENGATKLYYDNSTKLETTSGGVTVTGGVTTTTASTFVGDVTFDNGTNAGRDVIWDESLDVLKFKDNTNIGLGNDSDLLLYHNGHSYVSNRAGDLYLVQSVDQGNGIFLEPKPSEAGVKIFRDGAVELYFDGVKRMLTTDQGIRVEGHDIIIYADEGNSAAIKFMSDQGDDAGDRWKLEGNHSDSNNFEISNDTSSHGSYVKRLSLTTSGRLAVPSTYSDTGSSMRDVQVESNGNYCGQTSIRASKTNIVELSDVSWIYNLKPVSFNYRNRTEDDEGNITWLDEALDEKAHGLIAEEVEAVNKDFVFYNKDKDDNDVLAGVYYKPLIAPLLKAIQDQKTEIDTLKTKVAALEAA